MRRWLLIVLVGGVLSACATAYIVWWLTIEQTARIDTLARTAVTEMPLPLDGTRVAQSFSVPEGGTDEACVIVVNRSAGLRRLVVQVEADAEGAPAQVLSRAVRELQASSSACVQVPVPGAPASGRERWWVSLRAISVDASAGLHVVVAQHPSPHGRLLIGERERWGTLGLRVSAPHSTRWHHEFPRELYRPAARSSLTWLVGVVTLLAVGALLTTACTHAGGPRAAVVTVASVPLLLVSLHGLTQWTPPPPVLAYVGPGRPLLDQLGEADFQTSATSLRAGFEVVSSDIRPSADRALFALPASGVSWSVQVHEPTSLDTAVALRQEAWTHAGDGVTFTVSVSVDGRQDVLWRAHVDPFSNPGARRWSDVTVRLDRYVGREITLTLATAAGPAGNRVLDAAMWREPVLRPSVVR